MIDLSLQFPYPGQEKSYKLTYEGHFIGDYPVLESPEFELFVTFNKGNVVEIHGDGNLYLAIPCDRCLKDVRTYIEFSIEETVSLETTSDKDGEPVFFVEGNDLDTEELIASYVLSSLPAKVLCKEDCKGICFTCGADLNEGPCDCGKSEAPTRMADLLRQAMNKKNAD